MNKVYVLEGCKLHEQRVLLSVFSTYEKAEIALKFFEQKLNQININKAEAIKQWIPVVMIIFIGNLHLITLI